MVDSTTRTDAGYRLRVLSVKRSATHYRASHPSSTPSDGYLLRLNLYRPGTKGRELIVKVNDNWTIAETHMSLSERMPTALEQVPDLAERLVNITHLLRSME